MTPDSGTTHPRSRRRTIGVCVGLALALAIGLGTWRYWEESRVVREVGDLPGVVSAELVAEDSPASREVLQVEIDPSTGAGRIEAILEATEGVVDGESVSSARVSLGTAEVDVDSRYRYRADTRDAVTFLETLGDLSDGRAVLDEEDITFVDAKDPALENILEWLTTIEDEDLNVKHVAVQEEDGQNAISIHRLQAEHREVLESLGEWDSDITSIILEGSSLTVRTTVPFLDLGPLAEGAQSAARSLDPESPSVSLEAPDQRTLSISDEDPDTALELAGEIEEDGWSVKRLAGGGAAIDLSPSGNSTGRPAVLHDLAATLRSAGVPRDARVNVQHTGARFTGTRSDLEGVAPSITEAREDGYSVHWMGDNRGPGPDTTVWVEMPTGHSLTEDSDLEAAIDVARSISWPGAGAITFKTTPESGSSKDVREVTLTSTAKGTAEDVKVDPDRAPWEQQLREAWDATAPER